MRKNMIKKMSKEQLTICINEINGIKVLREIATELGCNVTDSMSREELRKAIIATK